MMPHVRLPDVDAPAGTDPVVATSVDDAAKNKLPTTMPSIRRERCATDYPLQARVRPARTCLMSDKIGEVPGRVNESCGGPGGLLERRHAGNSFSSAASSAARSLSRDEWASTILVSQTGALRRLRPVSRARPERGRTRARI